MSSLNHNSHKPRRKSRELGSAASHGLLYTDPVTQEKKPLFPLVGFLGPAKVTISKWIIFPIILMVVGLFRWATTFWGYSGHQKPPMFGDFEAQRHWMELTIHLPVSQWYFYDLKWWGLDYPPLTAYHSWVLGKIGSLVNPSFFELDTSRGLESEELKVFMRASVLLSEYAVYIPAAISFMRRFSHSQGVGKWDFLIAVTAVLMQPATILIDHGHFQYNTVMLGFVLASMSGLMADNLLWSCVWFIAALGFKQMALFFAPAIFAYLLGKCVFPKFSFGRLVSIAVTTIVSFAILCFPLLLGSLYNYRRGLPLPTTATGTPPPPLLSDLPFDIPDGSAIYPFVLQLSQAHHRIFPFARGLFEDKVANLWCALHTFHKLHIYPSALLQHVSLALTLLLILPPCIILFLKPQRSSIPLAFATTAWGFFLASYQVHEKNVLLPLLPMTVLLSGSGGLALRLRSWIGFANILAAWTLFPLLNRDGLAVPYVVLTLLWAWLLGLPPVSWHLYLPGRRVVDEPGLHWAEAIIHSAFYIAMVGWHICEAFIAPPYNKPDLWVVLNVLIGAAGFSLCYTWCLGMLMVQSGYWRNPFLSKPKVKFQ
ncbi:ALG6, ALG8 glycosyltransferase [Eremomyces bilateralis CBS 781.70]|uniref:Alpha-1,3-glucosyltransferase n=1 Tax=Eremomyces bilateralis CBS 781.70 TaxID=1392243 RepID=A0A6G1FT11_9PEZI|nr:ALG6, ALG8 glycosyltransferase [Eremomyces bilateralis CBS 781.70]KAF1808927.1 ALG6, ALG8 glycosyltransferase [Eremomyces bilateralis CBS 781.70]